MFLIYILLSFILVMCKRATGREEPENNKGPILVVATSYSVLVFYFYNHLVFA